jgi:cytochrome c oxidase subunit IV
MAHHPQHQHPDQLGAIPEAQTKGIWKTFGILVVLTAIEFLFAFVMEPSMLRNSIFIILTLFKAFFIVAEFMHLKHETRSLILTVLIPMALLVWLTIALIAEGSFLNDVIFSYWEF